ncbi:MAG TPA: permease prefix domain 1-containing protein [Streptosporangiaceae bacterium]|nr:permease prefix domain 1-containing protein [Streptosporangiaceae bacterium]
MTGSQQIDAYLSEVAAALPGPARTRRDIVAELRSGLLDAADAHRSTGLQPAPVAEAAIREFGDPRQVAAGFRPELAACQARRLAVTLLATGPLIGLLWAAAAVASHIGIRHAPPWQWAGVPPTSLIAFPLAAAAFLITVWTALFTIAATGRLARWLPSGPHIATTTAAIAGFGAAAADAAIFLLLASQLVSAPSILAPAPVAAAAVASLTRLTLARRGARHCLSARATLA